jgi:hypothetical protein
VTSGAARGVAMDWLQVVFISVAITVYLADRVELRR